MTWEADFKAVFGEAPPEWMVSMMQDPSIVRRPDESLAEFYIRKYGYQTASLVQELEQRIASYEASAGIRAPELWYRELEEARRAARPPATPQTIYAAGPPVGAEPEVLVKTGFEELFKPEYEAQALEYRAARGEGGAAGAAVAIGILGAILLGLG